MEKITGKTAELLLETYGSVGDTIEAVLDRIPPEKRERVLLRAEEIVAQRTPAKAHR